MSETEVLAANARFYAAFATRDPGEMEDVWAQSSPVVCIHPGWPPIRGRKEILASWGSIFEHDESPAILCEGPTVALFDDTASIVCRERIGNVVLVATNVFVREEGSWRLAHHHASALAKVPETPPMDPDLLPN